MPPSPRIPFLYNPKSGAANSATGLRSFLLQHGTGLTICPTLDAEDAQQLVAHYLSEGADRLVLSGGDGTINRLLPTLIGTQTALGVCPTGTMNVFARELGISTTDHAQMLHTIQHGEVKEVDVFAINGHPFIQMAGIGYDAHIIEQTSKEQKAKLGPLAYILSIAKVFGNTPPEITIETAEGHRVKGVCALIGNGTLYGGQLTLFNNASHSDQLIDLLVIKSSGYQALLDLAQKLLSGVAPNVNLTNENVATIQSRQVTITASSDLPYELDGEYYGRASRFEITLSPHRLRVLSPTQPVSNDWSERLSALWSLAPIGK